ncbi:hypothetical protein J8J14_02255 [Roseomonas sp. SSH11]|uniref:Uncharacterized protein n=1 Tax=Pararoseomonas baculiformis TaxID=2820812 RepID=A0ABS4ABC8_9PROT|nr:hypothetical protein [Pararoseomonas baculiformis]MBP0443589.1 hypothetical protein [Pararoseomonas baculiformis]
MTSRRATPHASRPADSPLPIAVIGAAPVRLAAAAHLLAPGPLSAAPLEHAP